MDVSPFLSLCPFFVLCTLGILLILLPIKERKDILILFGIMLISRAFFYFSYIDKSPFSPSIGIFFESIKGFALPLFDTLLFFSFLSLAFPFKLILRRCWFFLIPSIILGILYFTIFLSYSVEQQGIIASSPWHSLKDDSFVAISTMQLIVDFAVNAFSFFYLIVYFISLVFHFPKYLKNNFSNSERLDMRWVIYVGFYFLSFAVLYFTVSTTDNPVFVIILSVSEIFFGFFIYFLLNQYYIPNSNIIQSYFNTFFIESGDRLFVLSKLFPRRLLLEEKNELEVDERIEKDDLLLAKLDDYIRLTKPYLQKDLCLDDIARALYTNRTYISQLFSKKLNTTFYDYINFFRIEEAKEKLIGQPSLSLKSIAEECGFSSYTTFIKYFTKIEKCSPTEWKNTK